MNGKENGKRGFPGAALWFLALGPAAWLAHFLFFYSAAGIACARPGLGAGALWTPGTLATVAALVAVAAVARRGQRERRRERSAAETETSVRKWRFLGGLLLGIAAVSALAIAVTAVLPLVVGACR